MKILENWTFSLRPTSWFLFDVRFYNNYYFDPTIYNIFLIIRNEPFTVWTFAKSTISRTIKFYNIKFFRFHNGSSIIPKACAAALLIISTTLVMSVNSKKLATLTTLWKFQTINTVVALSIFKQNTCQNMPIRQKQNVVI